MNGQKLIFINATYLLFSNVGVRLVTAFATIMLARSLEVREFGTLSIALALASVASYLTDMGLTHTFIREGTRNLEALGPVVGSALRLRMGLAFFATIIFIIFIYAAYSDPQLQLVSLVIVLPAIWGGALRNFGEVYFQIIQEMKYTALISISSGLTVASILLTAVYFQWSLPLIAAAYGITALVSGALGLFLVTRRVPSFAGWHSGLLQGLGAFLLGGMAVLLLPQLGPLVLERATNLEQVGYFAAAYRIPALLYSIPGILATAFYPQLFHFGNSDPERHLALSAREIKSMSQLGIGLSLPFIFYPEWVVSVIFGAKWGGETSLCLSVLACMVIFQSINFPLADSLTTKGLQSRRAAILAVGLGAGALFYYFAGSRYGAFGGAIAAIAIESILLIGFCFTNPAWKRLLTESVLPMLGLALVSGFGAYLIRTFVPSQPLGFFLVPLLYSATILRFDPETKRLVNSYRFKEVVHEA